MWGKGNPYTLLVGMQTDAATVENISRKVDPEGWNGEGGGKRVQDGEHMYPYGRFIMIFGITNTIL